MKKEFDWHTVALIGLGIIWLIMAFMPDYTYLFCI